MWDPELEQDAQESNDRQVADFVTLDSGEKAVHSDGVQRDTTKGKTKFTLMFPHGVPKRDQLIVRIAELYTRGGDKYGDRNWENSSSEETLAHHLDALWRHFMEFYFDEPSPEDHAAAVVWNINAVEMTRRRLREARDGSLDRVPSVYEDNDPPYVYKPPGNYGGTAPTPEDYRQAFENAPACHHDHNRTARQASQFLAEAQAAWPATPPPVTYDLLRWADGDRVTETAGDPPGSWVYSTGGDVWYFEESLAEWAGVNRSARSLKNLIQAFGPLVVTKGSEFTQGLVIYPDGSVASYGTE